MNEGVVGELSARCSHTMEGKLLMLLVIPSTLVSRTTVVPLSLCQAWTSMNYYVC